MLWLKNSKQLDGICFLAILLIALARAYVTDSIGCPQFFDCNSYIRMVENMAPVSDIPGHHAMRIFPIFLVRLLVGLGFSVEVGFQIISAASYGLFGAGVYAFARHIGKSTTLAFGWALLMLSLHEAMRIPLYLVYQANDALVYPVGLGILVATYHRKIAWVLVLSVLGALTRQNLFVLGFLSILWLFKQKRTVSSALSLAVLTVTYMLLQNSYQAHGVFVSLLSPPQSFFSLSGQWQILIESQFLELWIALIPFILLEGKKLFSFFKEHWHWFLYAGITIFQPYVGFHLTGNNLPRLSLQGVWVIALSLAWVCFAKATKAQQRLFLVYAVAIYATWGIEERLVIMAIYSAMAFWLTVKKSELATQ